MKERLVRGTHVADVVRLLSAHKNDRILPELGTWERDLLRKRVSRSTWYSLAVFDSLLQVVHRYVFDGSEAAAQKLGRAFARSMIDESPALMVVPDDPEQTLARMPPRWHEHFNFGEVAVSPQRDAEGHRGVRVRLTGYPDMSACHGHTIVGWSVELAERAGAQNVLAHIEERPWMHNSVLTYTLHWD